MSTEPALSFVNPFHIQWDSRFFVGRQEEIQLFETNLGGLKQGQQSHVLVAGVNGTGKSFYLNKLCDIARSANCISVILDLPESDPYNQAWTILNRTIIRLQQQIAAEGSPLNTELSTDFSKGEQSTIFSVPKLKEVDAGAIQDDFSFIVAKAKAAGREGIIVCIDEGQRIKRTLLSSLKGALGSVPGLLVVIAWRLAV
jgi:hypothetical protein